MDKYSDLEKQCEEKNHDLRILTTQVTTIRAVVSTIPDGTNVEFHHCFLSNIIETVYNYS